MFVYMRNQSGWVNQSYYSEFTLAKATFKMKRLNWLYSIHCIENMSILDSRPPKAPQSHSLQILTPAASKRKEVALSEHLSI